MPIVGVVSESGPLVRRLFDGARASYKASISGVVLMSQTITNTQQTVLSIRPVFERPGKPPVDAPIQGTPVWACSNTDILAITPAGDGLSCLVVALGPIDNARVSVEADADMGDGVELCAGSFDFDVVAPRATRLEVTAGEVTEQP